VKYSRFLQHWQRVGSYVEAMPYRRSHMKMLAPALKLYAFTIQQQRCIQLHVRSDLAGQ
jgi:hypothetical protein